jgi:hypothetical protein
MGGIDGKLKLLEVGGSIDKWILMGEEETVWETATTLMAFVVKFWSSCSS